MGSNPISVAKFVQIKSTGIVSPASVGEQMLYEIGDPQSYQLPDVVCDFSQVNLQQSGPDRVEINGCGVGMKSEASWTVPGNGF